MAVPGIYFRIVSRIVKIFAPMCRVDRLSALKEPCVLLCRHRNMRGPVYSIVHWAGPARPWIFWPFFAKESFYAQMHGYTLTKRLRWPKGLASACAWLLSLIVPPLIGSLGGIPVYRNDSRIRDTFRQSMDRLSQGKHIIIYPDVDYVSNEDVGAVYEGFFLLERMWHKQTGKHLPFVPVHIDTHKRTMRLGTAVVFDDGDFAGQRERVKNEILRQWQQEGN